MTTALVTGAGGFLAGHLRRVLAGRGTMRIAASDVRAMRAEEYDAWHEADLTNAAAARALIERVEPSIVFHLAGANHGGAALLHAANVTAVANVLDAVRASAPAARVVLIGSAAEYGRVPADQQPVTEEFHGTPVSDYGRAKHAASVLASLAAKEWGAHVVVVRPFNAVGPGVAETLVTGAIIRRLRDALASPAPRSIRMGTVSSVRDFVAVEDVAEGILAAAERGRPGEAYNLCSGEGHRVSEVLERLLEFAGGAIAVEFDGGLMKTGEVDALVGSAAKAQRELGWRASTPLESSLRAAWDATAPAGIAR